MKEIQIFKVAIFHWSMLKSSFARWNVERCATYKDNTHTSALWLLEAANACRKCDKDSRDTAVHLVWVFQHDGSVCVCASQAPAVIWCATAWKSQIDICLNERLAGLHLSFRLLVLCMLRDLNRNQTMFNVISNICFSYYDKSKCVTWNKDYQGSVLTQPLGGGVVTQFSCTKTLHIVGVKKNLVV